MLVNNGDESHGIKIEDARGENRHDVTELSVSHPLVVDGFCVGWNTTH